MAARRFRAVILPPVSDHLEAAKQKMPGVPDALVMRSANARAAARGVSVDDILASWGGGAALPVGETPAPAPEPAAEPAAEAAATEAPAPAPAAEPATAPEAVATAPAPPQQVVWVMPGDDDEPIAPIPLGERVRSGILLGSALGAAAGVVAGAATFAWSGGQTLVIESGPAIAVDPTRAMLMNAVIFGVAGLVIALVSAALPGRFYRERAVESRNTVIGAAGLLGGAALGAVTGAIVGGGGEAILGQEPLVAVGAAGAFVWTAVLAVVMGAVVGVLAQVVTLPAGLSDEDLADSEAVRKRLSTGYLVPLVILVTLVGIIVGVGSLFLAFPGQAWVIALVVAGSILTFGFLATARPDMQITRTDVAVGFTGIAVVIIFMAVVANALVGGHGEEGEDEETVTEEEAPAEDGQEAPDAIHLIIPV